MKSSAKTSKSKNKENTPYFQYFKDQKQAKLRMDPSVEDLSNTINAGPVNWIADMQSRANGDNASSANFDNARVFNDIPDEEVGSHENRHDILMTHNEGLQVDRNEQPFANNLPIIQDVVNIEQIVQRALLQSQNQCMSMFRQEIKDQVRTTVEETMTELGKESADSM